MNGLTNAPQPPMRRADRAVVGEKKLLGLLAPCRVLHLAIAHPDAPYIVPMNFGVAVEDGAFTFYLHCAKEGRKLDLLRKNPNVGFSIIQDPIAKDGDTPCTYTCLYRSVVGTGTVEILETVLEKQHGFSVFMQHQTGKAFALTPAQVAPCIILRLRASRISGKSNR